MATAADLQNLLPGFTTVDPACIDLWLTEAAKTVPATGEWDPDTDTAQIYLAAHLMSINGIGPDRGAQALIRVKSVNSASLSFTKDDGGMGDFGVTSYGRLFYPIWKANVGGPRVTGTGEIPENMVDVDQP